MLLTIDQAITWSVASALLSWYVYKRFSVRYPLKSLRVTGVAFAMPFLIMLLFSPNESIPKAVGLALIVSVAALVVAALAAAVVAILKRQLLLAATLGAIVMMYAMASMGWLDAVAIDSLNVPYASIVIVALALSIEYFVKRLEHSRRDVPK